MITLMEDRLTQPPHNGHLLVPQCHGVNHNAPVPSSLLTWEDSGIAAR